jgi:hypothetical protein
MYKKDWIPTSHQELYDQVNQTQTYLMDEMDRMGLSGIAEWLGTEYNPKLNNLHLAYEAWENPNTRTPLIISTLKESEAAFIPVYRQLYSGYLRNNPLVTDTDLLAMGLPQRTSGRTPSPVPSTAPAYTVKTPLAGVVELHYFDDAGEESRKYAKPKGVHGVEIRWALLEEMTEDWETLTHSSFDTATPYRLTFDGTDRGKRLYFALRWENNTGQKGPWSPIGLAFIP